MMNNSDLSGFSRDELLQLVAAQQSRLRSQQEEQRQLAWLEKAQRMNAAAAARFHHPQSSSSSSFGGGVNSTTNEILASMLGGRATNDLCGTTGSGNNCSLGMGDIFGRPDTTLSARALDMLRTRSAISQVQQQQNALEATVKQMMLRQELLGGGGGGAGYSLATSPQVTTTALPPSMDDVLLERLIAMEQLQHQHLQQRQQQQLQQHLQQQQQVASPLVPNDLVDFLQLGRTGDLLSSGGQVAVNVPPEEPSFAIHRAILATPSVTDLGGADTNHHNTKPVASRKKTKRPLSAYNIFFKEEHAKIIAQKEAEKAEKQARGEPALPSDDDYSSEEDEEGNKTGKKRKRSLSTNQPGKRGKRQVHFENLTKVIGKRWKELPSTRIEEYKRQAEEAMNAYRKNLFQKIRNSVKDDHQ